MVAPTAKTVQLAGELDGQMKKLKDSMRGIQIRTAGFKKDHDSLARSVARFSVALVEAEALIATRNGRNGAGTRTAGGTK